MAQVARYLLLVCGRHGVLILSQLNLPRVINDSPPLQLWSVGLGAKPQRWTVGHCSVV